MCVSNSSGFKDPCTKPEYCDGVTSHTDKFSIEGGGGNAGERISEKMTQAERLTV